MSKSDINQFIYFLCEREVETSVFLLTRSADELLELIEYERWRQAKLAAEISSYQCRILRLGELLHRDSSVSSLNPSQVLSAFLEDLPTLVVGPRGRGRPAMPPIQSDSLAINFFEFDIYN